jgi:hypothetical protein
MRSHRSDRRTPSVAPMSSSPSKRTLPLASGGWSSPVRHSARVDLPDPLSPTTARDSPRSSEKDTPRSACTSPP